MAYNGGGEMGNIISKDVFDYLLDHMLDIHRKKMGIISAYSLDYDSYTSKLNFLNSYVREIEAFLETAMVQGEESDLPFVILGSVVYVSKHTSEHAKIKIVLPKEQPGINEKDIEFHTCFSDIGHSMLLKRIGENVQVGHGGPWYLIEKVVRNIQTQASSY
jgi:transcription elongation GreA/GreB family factor